jgi:hypothetical protein
MKISSISIISTIHKLLPIQIKMGRGIKTLDMPDMLDMKKISP